MSDLPKPGKPNPAAPATRSMALRLRQMLFEERWLLAGAGLVVLLAPWLSPSTQTAAMQSHRARVAQMSPADLTRLRQNLDDFRRLSPAERSRLQTLQTACEASPKLRTTLTEWHDWLQTRTVKDRDALLADIDPASRIERVDALVKVDELASRPQLAPEPGDMRDPGFDLFRRIPMLDRMRQLNVPGSREEFLRMRDVAAQWVELPAPSSSSPPVQKLAESTRVLSETVRRAMSVRGPKAGLPGQLGPVRFPPEVREALLAAMNPGPRQRVEQHENPEAVILAMLVTQTVEEARDLIQRLSREDLLDAEKSLSESLRRDFQSLPDDERLRRVRFQLMQLTLAPLLEALRPWGGDPPFRPDGRRPFRPEGPGFNGPRFNGPGPGGPGPGGPDEDRPEPPDIIDP